MEAESLERVSKAVERRPRKAVSELHRETVRKSVANRSSRGRSQRCAASLYAQGHTAAHFRALFLELDMLRLPIFKHWNLPIVNYLSSKAKLTPFLAGAGIVAEGAAGSSMMLVLRGSVEVWVGKQRVFYLVTGNYIGETMLLGIQDYWNLTLIAETACTICEVDRGGLLEFLDRNQAEKESFEAFRTKHRSVYCLWAGTLEFTCKPFKGLSEMTLRALDGLLVRRLSFPGEILLEEGTPGDELYILVHGTVNIQIAGRRVRTEQRDSSASPGEITKNSSCSDSSSTSALGVEPAYYGELFVGVAKATHRLRDCALRVSASNPIPPHLYTSP